MFTAEIDSSQNLVKLTPAGRVEPEDLEIGAENLQGLLAQVEPGFRILTDLSGVESMSVAAAPHVAHIMDLCDRRGVELVVRVLPA